MKTNTHPEPSIKREIGVFGVASNVLNISIRSGLFLFPAIVSGLPGNNGILAYVLCGLLFMLIVLCYVEVSSPRPLRLLGLMAAGHSLWMKGASPHM